MRRSRRCRPRPTTVATSSSSRCCATARWPPPTRRAPRSRRRPTRNASAHRAAAPENAHEPYAAALENLKRLCETHLAGQYHIEVIDLLVNAQLAAGDQILAVPTLVRKVPVPIRKIIGDLSNEEKVLVGLNIRPVKK